MVTTLAMLVLGIGWLVSDREPTSREMTLAYRKHIEKMDVDKSPKFQLDSRQRSNMLKLSKQRCDKIDVKRYRCWASVQIADHEVIDYPAVEDAYYSHDAKGWRFASVEK